MYLRIVFFSGQLKLMSGAIFVPRWQYRQVNPHTQWLNHMQLSCTLPQCVHHYLTTSNVWAWVCQATRSAYLQRLCAVNIFQWCQWVWAFRALKVHYAGRSLPCISLKTKAVKSVKEKASSSEQICSWITRAEDQCRQEQWVITDKSLLNTAWDHYHLGPHLMKANT